MKLKIAKAVPFVCINNSGETMGSCVPTHGRTDPGHVFPGG